MKIKEISIGKEMKLGLPNFSNITATCNITYQLNDDEKPDWDEAWDEVNRQMYINVKSIDATWMKEKEYGKFFKLTIKTPKRVKGENING